MACEYCGYIGGHHPRCPQYEPRDSGYYCSICDEKIIDGEEYIENNDGQAAHFDCFYGRIHMLEWLGFKLKTMEDKRERDF